MIADAKRLVVAAGAVVASLVDGQRQGAGQIGANHGLDIQTGLHHQATGDFRERCHGLGRHRDLAQFQRAFARVVVLAQPVALRCGHLLRNVDVALQATNNRAKLHDGGAVAQDFDEAGRQQVGGDGIAARVARRRTAGAGVQRAGQHIGRDDEAVGILATLGSGCAAGFEFERRIFLQATVGRLGQGANDLHHAEPARFLVGQADVSVLHLLGQRALHFGIHVLQQALLEFAHGHAILDGIAGKVCCAEFLAHLDDGTDSCAFCFGALAALGSSVNRGGGVLVHFWLPHIG